jgi:SOS-response transcriptional repressor LexA
MSQKPLTDIQHRVVDFISDFIAAQGYPPTVVEIKDSFGFKSGNSVYCHLKAIEIKGHIKTGIIKARSISIIQKDPSECMSIAINRLNRLTPAQQQDCFALIKSYSEHSA